MTRHESITAVPSVVQTGFGGTSARVHGVGTPTHTWFASTEGRPLFRFRVLGAHGRLVDSDSVVGLSSLTVHESPGHLEMDAAIAGTGITLHVDIDSDPEGCAHHFSAQALNAEKDALNVELRLPWFALAADDLRSSVGMVPIELGAVRPVADGALRNEGFFANPTFACEANVFPLAHVGSPDLGGIALEGRIERGALDVLEVAVNGFGRRTTAFLEPGSAGDLGSVTLRADDGVWRTAVDRFTADRRQPAIVASPDWLRYAGAIYNPLAEGGGGIYQEELTVSLAERISSFDELPRLLDEARELGTSVLQLFDYWEKDSTDPRPAYWHKGDYTPRRDLGGEEALRRGVRAVRAAGGHVIMYLEPFIVYRSTPYGQGPAPASAARDPWTGELVDTYPDNFTMAPWDARWHDYVVRKAEWLARDIGADGVFLDSFGWQWNWVCAVEGGPRRDAASWNAGTVALAADVRKAMRAIEPEAVVMTESLSLQLAGAVDGALDASFAWNKAMNDPRVFASPARRAYPQLNVFTNGRSREQLGQVFASGANLALSRRWLDDRDEVAELVAARTRFCDALVEATPQEMARHDDGLAALTLFEGARHSVLVAVNLADGPRRLQGGLLAEGCWEPATAATVRIPVGCEISMPARGLGVWSRAVRP